MDLCESRYLRSSSRLLPKVSGQTRTLFSTRSRLKKLVFWLLLFVPVVAVYETASYLIVKRAVPTRILHRVRPGESPRSPLNSGMLWIDPHSSRPRHRETSYPARCSFIQSLDGIIRRDWLTRTPKGLLIVTGLREKPVHHRLRYHAHCHVRGFLYLLSECKR